MTDAKSDSTVDSSRREKAVNLFTYLRELSRLRSTPVRNVDNYDQVLWFSDIPRELRYCHCEAWRIASDETVDDDTSRRPWLEIEKPKVIPPPSVSEDLEEWVREETLHDSRLDRPSLYEHIPVTIEAEHDEDEPRIEMHGLVDHPEISDQWDRYIETQWNPWAAEDRRRRSVLAVYNELFSMYQRQQRLGEQYEAVMAFGFLTWDAPKSGRIRRHALTARTELMFDAVRGRMSLHPAGEGSPLQLEYDPLELQDQPQDEERKNIERMLEEQGDDVWKEEGLQSALSAWVNSLPAQSQQYEHSLEAQSAVGRNPLIHLAPALILRKRSEQHMVRFFEGIIEQISEGGDLPPGIEPIIEIESDRIESVPTDPDDTVERPRQSDEEVFFPKPSNPEQRRIARQVESDVGVLVQGPPGTGKSHTIVNLVCHLLAQGKRVLVTSQTVRALGVLRGMFPQEMEELCVILLANDRTGMADLEKSVYGITEKKTHWSHADSDKRLKRLESELDQLRRSQSKAAHELRSFREAETYKHDNLFGRYSGTAQNIAADVNRERKAHDWLLDRPDQEIDPPISDKDILHFLAIWREVYGKNMEASILKERIEIERVPDSDVFASWVHLETAAADAAAAVQAARSHPTYEAIKNMPVERREKLAHGLAKIADKLEDLANHFHGWAETAAREIIAEQDRAWRELLSFTKQQIDEVDSLVSTHGGLTISGLEDRDLLTTKAHAETLHGHLSSGKKLGFAFLRSKAIKETLYLTRDIRVEGRLCDNLTTIGELLGWIDINVRLTKLDDHWSGKANVPTGTLASRIAHYSDLCEPLDEALELHQLVVDLRSIINATQGLSAPKWHVSSELLSLKAAADAAEKEAHVAQARSQFPPLIANIERMLLKKNVHPCMSQLAEAVQERSISKYHDAIETMKVMEEWTKAYGEMTEVRAELEKHIPLTFKEFVRDWQNDLWEKRFSDFCGAWNWARADAWLEELCDPNLIPRKTKALEDMRQREHKCVGILAAEKAWQACIKGLNESRRRYLEAWMQAVKKITKTGRGKYDESRRSVARDNMAKCREAIPAWIMPIYRVVESLRPGQDAFDVVIVDEASQSGPEAMFLHYIAPKVIVVGDDKQIRPTHVGVNREQVEVLQKRYLTDIPHPESFDLEGSFFSQAAIRYANHIRLREHFRCMPEIIGFSNRYFYKTEPLVPLRQFGTDRLEPAVRAEFVKDGYLKARDNPAEAKAIVQQIAECIGDPAYEGKTFGVISLVSTSTQDKLIERMLQDEIGADEMNARQLICGDPYTFQGDERDVIFLSLVVAPQPNQRIRAVTGQEAERRFNVAASRAKDQMWLFHSVTLNDLNPADLRHRLLEYCKNPTPATTHVGDISVDDIRTAATAPNRRDALRPPPFDSWFEIDVFLKIVEMGYRVIPQYEVAGRRIDLVIEGLKTRLAVECDGDEWHGPEQFDEDMARERELRRCGWKFWRIRGSDFYREPDKALESLWDELSANGILPGVREDEDGAATSSDVDEEQQEEGALEDVDPGLADEGGISSDRLGRALEYAKAAQSNRRPEDVSASEIRDVIVQVLTERSNNTCAMKHLTTEVLRFMGIRTRATPRQRFEARVKRATKALCRQGVVKEYSTSKNKRVRLVAESQRHLGIE